MLINGIFAGAEIAVITLRRTRLQELLGQGAKGARSVDQLRSHPERFLATVQIGITVVSTTAAAFGGERVARGLAPAIARVPWLRDSSEVIALTLVVALVSFLSLVLGELVPKSLALRAAEPYALVIGRPLVWLSYIARPLVWSLTRASNLVLKVFGDQTSFTEARLSPEELQELVAEAGRTGSLDPRTSEIASRALEFRDLLAREVMIPRTSIVSIPVDADADRLLQALSVRSFAHLPVWRGDRENIVGFVAVKDLLARALRGQVLAIEPILKPVHFIPETVAAVGLFKEMQQRRLPLAIAVDEAGSIAGMITIEDLLEELVGDVFSQDDTTGIRREDDGAALVQGAMPLREVNRALGLDLPESEEYSTVAGLCLDLAGRIPAAGTRLRAADGTMLEIVDAAPQRVRMVRIRPPVPAERTDDDTDQ